MFQVYITYVLVILFTLWGISWILGAKQVVPNLLGWLGRQLGDLLRALARGLGNLVGAGLRGFFGGLRDLAVWAAREAYYRLRYNRPAPPLPRPRPQGRNHRRRP